MAGRRASQMKGTGFDLTPAQQWPVSPESKAWVRFFLTCTEPRACASQQEEPSPVIVKLNEGEGAKLWKESGGRPGAKQPEHVKSPQLIFSRHTRGWFFVKKKPTMGQVYQALLSLACMAELASRLAAKPALAPADTLTSFTQLCVGIQPQTP